MPDNSEEIEHKDLVIIRRTTSEDPEESKIPRIEGCNPEDREDEVPKKDGNGDIVFELSDIGILSVENSEGSLTVEIELNDDLSYGRSVFKTE